MRGCQTRQFTAGGRIARLNCINSIVVVDYHNQGLHFLGEDYSHGHRIIVQESCSPPDWQPETGADGTVGGTPPRVYGRHASATQDMASAGKLHVLSGILEVACQEARAQARRS
jgi:hypothetical protein